MTFIVREREKGGVVEKEVKSEMREREITSKKKKKLISCFCKVAK